jgi:hypothetical protein
VSELRAPKGYSLMVDTAEDGLSVPWDLRQTEPPPERKGKVGDADCSWCGAHIRSESKLIMLLPKEACPLCPIRARVEKMLANGASKATARSSTAATPLATERKERAGERDYRNGYAAGTEDERHFTIRMLRAWDRDAASMGWPERCREMLRLAVQTLEEKGHRPTRPTSGRTA